MTRHLSLHQLRAISSEVARGVAIRSLAAAHGMPHVSLWRSLRQFDLPSRRQDVLTLRQRNIIEARADGMRNPEIAAVYAMAPSQIADYVRRANRVLERTGEGVPGQGEPRWPQERTDQFYALLASDPDLSARQIGKRLGLSKNAAIGKLHRLGYRKTAEGWERGV